MELFGFFGTLLMVGILLRHNLSHPDPMPENGNHVPKPNALKPETLLPSPQSPRRKTPST